MRAGVNERVERLTHLAFHLDSCLRFGVLLMGGKAARIRTEHSILDKNASRRGCPAKYGRLYCPRQIPWDSNIPIAKSIVSFLLWLTLHSATTTGISATSALFIAFFLSSVASISSNFFARSTRSYNQLNIQKGEEGLTA